MNNIAIIGLGYVGLPLAVAMAKKYKVTGFDIKEKRIRELNEGKDVTGEIEPDKLARVQENLAFTSQEQDIKDCNIKIITVPTPIDQYKKPDLKPLLNASKLAGQHLQKNDIVIYESTVFPGCTEEECVPVLEGESGLTFNRDFYVGYSPERINPGDKEHRVETIQKVTSGSTPGMAEKVDQLYKSVITAGTHKTSSIKVAEAAKVIENAQRDLNIAFVNELSLIFNRIGIDTLEVLEAAGTKWNFSPFKPGLVGGHCIGVDPYYLTYKAESIGYHPEVILSGRRINDNMGHFVASNMIKMMAKKGHPIHNGRVLVCGLTFKENTPDIRNTRVTDIIDELKDFGVQVDIYDPLVDKQEAYDAFGYHLIEQPEVLYEGVIMAVAHQIFMEMDWKPFTNDHTIFYDIKGVFQDKSLMRL